MGQTCSAEDGQVHKVAQTSATSSASAHTITSTSTLASQYCLHQSVHTGPVLHLASSRYLSQDSQVFSSSDDKTISALKWASPLLDIRESPCSISQRYLGHTKAVNRLAVDGKRGFLWSVSRDLSIKQWKATADSDGGSQEMGTCVQSMPNAAELNLSSIALDEDGDGSYVYVGSRDYSVKQYDVSTGQAVATFSSPRNIVTSIAVGSVGASTGLVYQSSEDLKIRIWDPRASTSKVPAGEIAGFVYFALCMDLHPDGNLLAAGCKGFNGVGCEVKIFDLRAIGNGKQPVHNYHGHTQDVTSCKFLSGASGTNFGGSLMQKPLVTCCKDGTIRVWDVFQAPSTDTDEDPALDVLQTQRNYTSLAPLWSTPGSTHTKNNMLSFAAGCFDGGTQHMSLNYDPVQNQVNINVNYSTPPYAAEENDAD